MGCHVVVGVGGGKWIGAGFQGQETHSVVGPFMGGVLQIRYAYIFCRTILCNVFCLLSDVFLCWVLGEVRQG